MKINKLPVNIGKTKLLKRVNVVKSFGIFVDEKKINKNTTSIMSVAKFPSRLESLDHYILCLDLFLLSLL